MKPRKAPTQSDLFRLKVSESICSLAEFSPNPRLYAALAAAAVSGGMMDGRGLIGATPSPDLSGATSNGVPTGDPSSSYAPSYRYPPHSGYSGSHQHPGAFPPSGQLSASVASMRGSPVSSGYSPPSQFRTAQNGSILGGAGYGNFYGGQEPPQPQQPQQAPEQSQQLRRQTSFGGDLGINTANNGGNVAGSSESGSFGSGAGSGSNGSGAVDGNASFIAQHHHHRNHQRSDSGPLQQDIHAN